MQLISRFFGIARIILTLLLVFYVIDSCSVERDSQNQYSEFRNNIIKMIGSRGNFIKCESGISLLRFDTDSDGKIRRFYLSENSSWQIKQKFKDIDFSKLSYTGERDAVYILPYIYNFQTGCIENLESSRAEHYKINVSLNNQLFDFEVKNWSENCIMLEPIRESSME